MKKIGLTIILLLALTAAALYSVTWYGTHQALARLKTNIADKGVLAWQSVRPGLDGSVEVQNLELMLFELSQPVRISSAHVSTGSALALGRWFLWPGADWPESVRLELNHAALIIRPTMTKAWLEAASPERPQWPKPWHLRACGDRSQLTGADLLAMGIDQLEMDLKLHWRRLQEGGHELVGELHTGVLGSLDFDIVRGALPEPAQAADASQWQRANVVVRDGGFMRRLAAFCANGRHVTTSEWAEAEADALQGQLARWGITPTVDLRDFYLAWLNEGGVFTAALPHLSKADYGTIEAVAEYIDRDDLQLKHNGQMLAKIGFDVSPDVFLATSSPTLPKTAEPAPAVADDLDWRETPVGTAEHWKDRLVRVELAPGHSLEGRLSDINKRQLIILRRVAGGEFASPVARSEVAAFSVLRRRSEQPPAMAVLPDSGPVAGLETTVGERADQSGLHNMSGPAAPPEVSGESQAQEASIF